MRIEALEMALNRYSLSTHGAQLEQFLTEALGEYGH
jgi:hypothetical protein